MFYTGQPVFVTDDKFIGIFLGEDDKLKTPADWHRICYSIHNRSDFYIMVYKPSEEKRFKIDVYEYADIAPLIKADPSNLITGQSVYYGPKSNGHKYKYRSNAWHSKITTEEVKANLKGYLAFLEELASEEWVINNYLEPKTTV